MSNLEHNVEVRINKGKAKFVYVDKGEEHYYSQFGYLKGKSKWAKVLAPDDYGNFAVDVYADEEDYNHIIEVAQELLDQAKEQVELAGKTVKNINPLGKETDEGEKYIQFKRKALKPDGTEVSPPKIYDASGTYQPTWDRLVGNDSTVKVGYTLTPYFVNGNLGVSFKFYAVQVIKLVEFSSGGSGKNEGFGDETDGDAPFDNEDF